MSSDPSQSQDPSSGSYPILGPDMNPAPGLSSGPDPSPDSSQGPGPIPGPDPSSGLELSSDPTPGWRTGPPGWRPVAGYCPSTDNEHSKLFDRRVRQNQTDPVHVAAVQLA